MSFTDIATSLLFNSGHSLGNGDVKVIPDLVMRERHKDTLGITSHPIQTGAAITDHAYVIPPQFTLEWGWSNSSLKALTENFSDFRLSNFVTGKLGENYINEVYESLRKLQQKRVLCTVVTSKRKYKNVLIESIDTETTENTTYSMMVILNCRSVQIVETSMGKISTPTNVQKFASKTSSQLKMGTKQLKNVDNDSLSDRISELFQ